MGEENGNPLQYSCLENPMDRGAWQAIIHGVTESDMTEQLNHHIMNPCLLGHTPLFLFFFFFSTCNLGFTVLKTVSSMVEIIFPPSQNDLTKAVPLTTC